MKVLVVVEDDPDVAFLIETRNQHKTTRKVGRRLEGIQRPPPRKGWWSREAGES